MTKIETLVEISEKAVDLQRKIDDINTAIELYTAKYDDDTTRMLELDLPVAYQVCTDEMDKKLTKYFVRLCRQEKKESEAKLQLLSKKLK